MTRRTLALTLLLSLPPLAALGVRAARGSGTGDGARAARGVAGPARGGDAEDAAPVRVAPIERGTIAVPIVATGEAVRPRVAVVAPFDGRVTHVAVRDGQAVRVGEPLARLDSADAALDLARALATQRQAELLYLELSANDGRVADSATRAARLAAASVRSGRETAAVDVSRARLNLARAHVRAPVAGRAADVRARVGAAVRAGEELMAVVAHGDLRVELPLLETAYRVIARGRAATVTFAALPGEAFPATVAEVTPRVDAETRTMRVSLAVRDPRGLVLSGMHARASIDGPPYAGRLVVPRAAVLERDGRPLVFTYEPRRGGTGRARWRYVTVGVANDSLVEVRAAGAGRPLAPGELVVVEGHATLTHDAPLRLAPDPASGDAGVP